MSLGPIELLFVSFPGSRFKGQIAPALTELVETGTIRVIDILFVRKDEDGALTLLEINDLDDEEYAVFDPVVADVTGLLTEDDVRSLSGSLDNGSSAGLMVFENTWATRFVDAIADAGGEVVLNERIPRAVVQRVLSAPAEARA